MRLHRTRSSRALVFVLLSIVGASVCVSPASAQVVFGFDDNPLGQLTSFTNSDPSGLQATFSSPSDPGAFAVQGSFFDTLDGNILIANDQQATLNITFNHPVSSISIDFGTDDEGTLPSPVTLDAFLGGLNGTLQGTQTATGTVQPDSGLPEGIIEYTDPKGVFDSVRLSVSPAPYFAVNNIQVQVAAVPELSSGASLGIELMALSLIGLGLKARKQMSRVAQRV